MNPTEQTHTSSQQRATRLDHPADSSAVDSYQEPHEQTDSELVQSTGSMAIATLLSRITGFFRSLLLVWALGGAITSAFTTANTLPNMITELVLGAVLTSLVIPVLVRAEKDDPDHGVGFIRRLLTFTFSLMLVVTVIAVATAPFLTGVMLQDDGKVNVEMSTAFAYLLLPQIVFYSLFAVFMAILNTKNVFKPGAWAPVANNVITIIVLAVYMALPDQLNAGDTVSVTDPRIIWLGVGTTAGVVVQALIMVPYLRKAGIDIRPLWGIDARLKQFGGMAIAIVAYVAISQAGYIVSNNVASSADDSAITIYAQMWQLLQLPYGVIGVTLLTAVMPRLSRHAAANNIPAVIKDLATATRLTLLALIPVVIFLFFFGTQLAISFFAMGNFSRANAEILGSTVSWSAFTLIPYALVLLHLRVFYAREEVWTPTYIVAGITVTKIIFALLAPQLATDPQHVVVLLGVGNGLAYVAGAVIGHMLLRRSLGSVSTRTTGTVAVLISIVSLLAGVITYLADSFLHATVLTGEGNITFIIRTIVGGVVFLIFTGVGLFFVRSQISELFMLTALLARIPVLGRFFHAPYQEDTADNHSTGGADDAEDVPNEVLNSFPPIQKAAALKPFLPGETTPDGRYRLIKNHGGRPGIQFWEAQVTGSPLVKRALSIIDKNAVGFGLDTIIPRTLELMNITSLGIAPVQEVTETQDHIFVLSLWTPGYSMAEEIAGAPASHEAGVAVAHLAEGVAQAHALGVPAGVDTQTRIRVTADGQAVLAFAGTLPSDSVAQDIHGLGVTLNLLTEHNSTPEVQTLVDEAKYVAGVNVSEWGARAAKVK